MGETISIPYKEITLLHKTKALFVYSCRKKKPNITTCCATMHIITVAKICEMRQNIFWAVLFRGTQKTA